MNCTGIPVLNKMMRDTVMEVDLDRIVFNVKQIKAMAGPGTQVAVVVKADGYGRGALGVVPAIMENGASLLVMATLSEAVESRQTYPDCPVLITELTPDRLLPCVLEHDITQTIDTLTQTKFPNRLTSGRKQQTIIHIKYDTGFHRIGFPDCPGSLNRIRQICSMPQLKPEGIYFHLALKDDQFNQAQLRCFMDAVNELGSKSCHLRYKRIADSITAVDFPEYRPDMVRAGAIIYGLKDLHKGQLDVRQALTSKARISHIAPVLKDQRIGYDYLWTTLQDARVAVLLPGYVDGYPRNLRNKAMVTLRRKQAPVIRVICMDQYITDLTGAPEIQIRDQVVTYGNGSGNALDINAVGRLAGTSKNEIVARPARRPLRICVRGSDSRAGYSSAGRVTPWI